MFFYDTIIGNVFDVVSGWKVTHYYPRQAKESLNGNDVYKYVASKSTPATIITGGIQACINAGYTTADCNHYKIGNYYNFTAATAMSNTVRIQ